MEATTKITDAQIEQELVTIVLPWVAKLATPPLEPSKTLQQNLRDGVVLCKYNFSVPFAYPQVLSTHSSLIT
jgi:hypothetical protein